MNLTKLAVLPFALFAAIIPAGCSTDKPTSESAPPAPVSTAPQGVMLRGLITAPPNMAPKAVCWDGGAPGAVAVFTGIGEGTVKVTLSSEGKTLATFDENTWMMRELAPTEGHVEIAFHKSDVQPGVVHIRLDGIDNSRLEFDVTYTGKECDLGK